LYCCFWAFVEKASRKAQRLPCGQVFIVARVLRQIANALANLRAVFHDVQPKDAGAAGCRLPQASSSLIVVDLPAPFGPRKPKIELRATVRLRDWSAFTPLNVLVSPCVLITSVSGGFIVAFLLITSESQGRAKPVPNLPLKGVPSG